MRRGLVSVACQIPFLFCSFTPEFGETESKNTLKNNLSSRCGVIKRRFTITRSEEGLATGLGSVETDSEFYWVGWPGIHTENEKEKAEITERLHELNFHPVFLSAGQIKNYYEGYSNSTIWPLCHYFNSFIEYKAEYWANKLEIQETE